jgi:hypothetical protein
VKCSYAPFLDAEFQLQIVVCHHVSKVATVTSLSVFAEGSF